MNCTQGVAVARLLLQLLCRRHELRTQGVAVARLLLQLLCHRHAQRTQGVTVARLLLQILCHHHAQRTQGVAVSRLLLQLLCHRHSHSTQGVAVVTHDAGADSEQVPREDGGVTAEHHLEHLSACAHVPHAQAALCSEAKRTQQMNINLEENKYICT